MLKYLEFGSSRPQSHLKYANKQMEPTRQIMPKSSKKRSNKMRRLSTMVEPMIAFSAQTRGFAISRIISHWNDIVGDAAEWCRPSNIHFPQGCRNNGTLKLQIVSGRGPQAQAMSQQIINSVNAVFGYQAIERITLVQSLTKPKQSPVLEKPANISNAKDIWSLDEKLKDLKPPELRAALRRLGGSSNDMNGYYNNNDDNDHT